jgi:hypothetical protein
MGWFHWLDEIELRQAQLFARLDLLGDGGCLPRLPCRRLWANVMNDFVEEIDGDVKVVEESARLMRIVLGEIGDSSWVVKVDGALHLALSRPALWLTTNHE